MARAFHATPARLLVGWRTVRAATLPRVVGAATRIYRMLHTRRLRCGADAALPGCAPRTARRCCHLCRLPCAARRARLIYGEKRDGEKRSGAV